MSLLDIRNLCVRFGTEQKPFLAVDSVDLSVDQGELLGIVGESGSGKSVSMMAMMGLLDGQGTVTADQMQFDGKELSSLGPKEKRRIIGKDIAMIFQDPMTALNPSYTVGFQIEEVLKVHLGLDRKARRQRAIELMREVEIPDPERRLSAYPHQLSGGMSQRVAIAMAIACEPRLLIADEPTTALDVTIQAQIMDLLLRLQKERGMALMMITHDLAVVSEVAQRVVVMYAGQVAETGSVQDFFFQPAHPYTRALIESIPESCRGSRRLSTLPGIVPGQYDRPTGCLLSPRCPIAQERCVRERPELIRYTSRAVRCHTPLIPLQELKS
ncbi:peptide ABC transporter ATP-binding protein [Advenella kashmirensis W13003]|uniref:Peptide ABC transporter ATP-binding protein n=1 Tax=Advenella kashmirensis W13003 TaxID=1424334 RepID=V8QQS2_9BURK|nr:oligopeptide/dipeptide ABC transporter ATP-binding protein [Advenella kashmirensis]ETF01339.1 peptide ABC transporter ATP-binding protein [Advenella kashmirensis W13003]